MTRLNNADFHGHHGTYPGLVVEVNATDGRGRRLRGRTHCIDCGGQTRQCNKDKVAQHQSCGRKRGVMA